MRLSDGCSSSSILLKSAGESEKNAISEAETKPEQYNKTHARRMAIIAPKDGALTVTPLQSSCK